MRWGQLRRLVWRGSLVEIEVDAFDASGARHRENLRIPLDACSDDLGGILRDLRRGQLFGWSEHPSGLVESIEYLIESE